MKIPDIAGASRAGELATRLTRLNDAVKATSAARQKLEQHLAARDVALRQAEQRATRERQAEAEAFTRRQSELESALADEVTRCQGLEEKLTQQQAEFSAILAQALEARDALAQRMNDALAAIEQSHRDRTADAAAAAEELAQRESALISKLEDALKQVERRAADQEAAAEDAKRCQAEYDAHLKQEIARRQAVDEELANTRAASEKTQLALVEQVAAVRQHLTSLEEHAARERAEWESTQVGDRERIQQLQIEGDLAQRSLVAADEQIRRLQTAHGEERANLERTRKELDAASRQRDALKITANDVSQLQKQIRDIRVESRDQFDNAPVNMCRCSRTGAITRVNHALARLLGYDTREEVQKADFADTVFESPDELQWIVDRCLASRSIESVDTAWKRKNGTRLIVRVFAVATTDESIDLTAQDVTAFRELEEKLRSSQRMEAVARYASEVAVNCDNLLRHVKEEGEQWLARMDSGTARHHAELLLDEVTRAAGLLRQLGVYGNEQKKVPELVEVNKVLRDMAPVLKQVAGGNIELVLPKASTPLNLDVEAERVERMLVNVAAYGRERMPFGGRMTIDVASVVVDREFVAKHPNVRPGAHVLLTVNEVRREVRGAPVPVQAFTGNAVAADHPGVDLGVLQALVSDCGGHLWMMAEPPGDMVLKIHLPRRVLDRANPPPPKRPAGGRWINRLPGIRH